MFLLINMQKTKTYQKYKIAARSICFCIIMSLQTGFIAQKMKFSIKDFFSKYDQTRSFQRIWSHLLKKSFVENFFVQCFYPIHNVYFNDVQISRSIHLSSSLWGISLRCDLFRKRIDQTNFLLQQQITELYQLLDVCKLVFCFEFSDIREKLWRRRR